MDQQERPGEQLPLFPTEKRCARCKEMKPVALFGQRTASRDGLHPYCGPCVQEYKRLEYKRRKAGLLTERQQLATDGLKRCTRCQEVKPLAAFKRQRQWRFSLCKACQREQRRMAHKAVLGEEYGAHDRLLAQGLKRCGACQTIKELRAFGDHTKARDGLNWWCKACNAGHAMAHYARHSAQKIAYARAYYDANRQRILAADREARRWLRENDPQAAHALYQAHYQRYKAGSALRARAWVVKHPGRARTLKRASYHRTKGNGKHRVCGHNRRVRLLAAGGRLRVRDIVLLLEVQRGLCAYCGVGLDATYHVDHMTALSRGGGGAVDNVCLACASCNLHKHVRSAGQWLAALIMKRRALGTAQAAV